MPKKKNKSSSSLRGRAEDDVSDVKDVSKLKAEAKIVYDWLNLKKSTVRAFSQWQAAGGLSFNANVYHTCMMAFIGSGNDHHVSGDADPKITLEEFQKCILARHQVSSKTKEPTKKRRRRSEEED